MKARSFARFSLAFVLAAPAAIACGGNVGTTGTGATTGSSAIAAACAAQCGNPTCAALVPAGAGDCLSWCNRGYDSTSLGACASQWVDLLSCLGAEGCGGGTCADQVNATQACCTANPSACTQPKTDGGATGG